MDAPTTEYELRFHFDSPAAAGEASDAAIRAIMLAGVPMASVVIPEPVALEGEEYRDLTPVEEAAFDAGVEQAGPDAGEIVLADDGTLEIVRSEAD